MGAWKPISWSSILSVPFLVAAKGRTQSSVDHRLKTTELGNHLKSSPILKLDDFTKHRRFPYHLKRQVGHPANEEIFCK